MTIPRSDRVHPEPRGLRLPSPASWRRLSAALILVEVAAVGGTPPVAQAASAQPSLRGVGLNACNAAGSARGRWPSAHDLADALRAQGVGPRVVAVAIPGPGGLPGMPAGQAADPCEGAFFDRWSQTWFTRIAGSITTLPFCPVPGRPVG